MGLATLAPAQATRGAQLTNAFYAMDTAFQRPGLTSAQQFDLVKDLGFAGISWHEQSPAEAKATARDVEQRGLRFFTIYCGAQVSPDGDLTYSPHLPALMEALQGHHTIIWLHIGGQGPAFDTLTGSEPAVQKLRVLAGMAAANGLRVAIYPHVGEWTARFGDATKLAQVVKHPQFGVTFNLCHSLAMGEEARIPALLEAAAPVLFTVTINGADTGVTGPNWNRLIQTLAKGSYDVGSLLRKLHALGFTGPIGFQGYGIKDEARSILEPTMAQWRKLTAPKGAALR